MTSHDFLLQAYRTRGKDPQGEYTDNEKDQAPSKAVYEDLHHLPPSNMMTPTQLHHPQYCPQTSLLAPTSRSTSAIRDYRDEYIARVGGGTSSRNNERIVNSSMYYSRYSTRSSSNVDNGALQNRGTTTNVNDSSKSTMTSQLGVSSDIQSKLEAVRIRRSSEASRIKLLMRENLTVRNCEGTSSSYSTTTIQTPTVDISYPMNNTRKEVFGNIDNRVDGLQHHRSYSDDTTVTGNKTKRPTIYVDDKSLNVGKRQSTIPSETATTLTTATGKRKSSYNYKSVAMKILCAKILSGYTMTRNHCPECKMALLSFKGGKKDGEEKEEECVYCPIGRHRANITEAIYNRIKACEDSSRRSNVERREDPPGVGDEEGENDIVKKDILCDGCSLPVIFAKEDCTECRVCSITQDVSIKIADEQSQGGTLTDRRCVKCGNPEMCREDRPTRWCVVCEVLKTKVGDTPCWSNTEGNNTLVTPPKYQPVEESPSSLATFDVAGRSSTKSNQSPSDHHHKNQLKNEVKDLEEFDTVKDLEEFDTVKDIEEFVTVKDIEEFDTVKVKLDDIHDHIAQLSNIPIVQSENMSDKKGNGDSMRVCVIDEVQIEKAVLDGVETSTLPFVDEGAVSSAAVVDWLVKESEIDGRDLEGNGCRENHMIRIGKRTKTNSDSTSKRSDKSSASIKSKGPANFNEKDVDSAAPHDYDPTGVGLTLGRNWKNIQNKKKKLGTGREAFPKDETKISNIVLRSRRNTPKSKRITKRMALNKSKRIVKSIDMVDVPSTPVVWLAKESPSESWIIEGKGGVESVASTISNNINMCTSEKSVAIESNNVATVQGEMVVDSCMQKSGIDLPTVMLNTNELFLGNSDEVNNEGALIQGGIVKNELENIGEFDIVDIPPADGGMLETSHHSIHHVSSSIGDQTEKACNKNGFDSTEIQMNESLSKVQFDSESSHVSKTEFSRLESNRHERHTKTDGSEPAVAAGTARNDFKSMVLMKSRNPVKSTRNVSKCILDKLAKIEQQQQLLTVEENRDESIKHILAELKDIRQQQQVEIYTQHHRELMLQQKIHELEKETAIAGNQLHTQVQLIAAAAASSSKMTSLAFEQPRDPPVFVLRGDVEDDDQTLQHNYGECNLQGVAEDDEQTLQSDYSSIGNTTYNGGLIHRCSLDGCVVAEDIIGQLHGIGELCEIGLNGGGFKFDCGFINCAVDNDGGSVEINEDVLETVETATKRFHKDVVETIETATRRLQRRHIC